MPAFLHDYSLLIGLLLIMLDLLLWQAIPPQRRNARIAARFVAFVLFTWVLIDAGMSPLQPPPWPDDVARNLLATVLEIGWWLFGARVVTIFVGLLLGSRSSHTGRLLQDVLGAVIFLVAIVAAAAYVMQLPVKGLLATSGVMAIVIGLALQSTLADVFSGIILNTTRPYQIDDFISIDGTEGRVIDIDWRATRLLTGNGSMAVIPNSVAAKAKLLNFSRPSDVHGVSITVVVPASVRPRTVLDALEKTLQGTRALVANPKPKVAIKTVTLESVEYEASGFVDSMGQKGEVRNHLFDLAHRHLEAAGVLCNSEGQPTARSRQRALLDEVKIFRSLSAEDKDSLAQRMASVQYLKDQVIVDVGERADHVMVIATGVVSASIQDGDTLVEAGRMGPGEVLGIDGLIDERTSNVQFRSLTSSLLFRLAKDDMREYLEAHGEVKAALTKLQLFRYSVNDSMLLRKPPVVKKGGFLSWLHKP